MQMQRATNWPNLDAWGGGSTLIPLREQWPRWEWGQPHGASTAPHNQVSIQPMGKKIPFSYRLDIMASQAGFGLRAGVWAALMLFFVHSTFESLSTVCFIFSSFSRKLFMIHFTFSFPEFIPLLLTKCTCIVANNSSLNLRSSLEFSWAPVLGNEWCSVPFYSFVGYLCCGTLWWWEQQLALIFDLLGGNARRKLVSVRCTEISTEHQLANRAILKWKVNILSQGLGVHITYKLV